MKIKVLVEKNVCLKCGHIWLTRKEDVRQCPKCKTAYYDQPKKEKK